MGVDDLLQKAKESAGNLTDKISDLKDDILGDDSKAIVDEFKEAGSNKIQEVTDMLDESKNFIVRSGYEIASIGLVLGIPPKINLTFNYKTSVTSEEREKLLLEAASNKILLIILKSLFKAGDFYNSAKFKDYKLSSVDISLGLTPGVSIKFVK